MRYFRASRAVYAEICRQLDAAYGYPSEDTKTQRSLPLAKDLPSDESGRVYLAVEDAFCEYDLPSVLLPQLIASGAVQELTEAEYMAAMPASPYG